MTTPLNSTVTTPTLTIQSQHHQAQDTKYCDWYHLNMDITQIWAFLVAKPVTLANPIHHRSQLSSFDISRLQTLITMVDNISMLTWPSFKPSLLPNLSPWQTWLTTVTLTPQVSDPDSASNNSNSISKWLWLCKQFWLRTQWLWLCKQQFWLCKQAAPTLQASNFDSTNKRLWLCKRLYANNDSNPTIMQPTQFATGVPFEVVTTALFHRTGLPSMPIPIYCDCHESIHHCNLDWSTHANDHILWPLSNQHKISVNIQCHLSLSPTPSPQQIWLHSVRHLIYIKQLHVQKT